MVSLQECEFWVQGGLGVPRGRRTKVEISPRRSISACYFRIFIQIEGNGHQKSATCHLSSF